MKHFKILFIIILLGCKDRPIEDLKLTIYTKKVELNSNNIDSIISSNYRNTKLIRPKVVSFAIENTSTKTYLFLPISRDFRKGSVMLLSFPKLFAGLGLSNILLTDENGKEIERGDMSLMEPSDVELKREEEITEHYKRLDYNLNETKSLYSGMSIENSIIIPPKTKIYFESYFSLPINNPTIYRSTKEVMRINTKSNYTLKMIFYADKKEVVKRLTRDLKKTVEDNQFEIFEGYLYSNEIPVVFK